MKVNKFGLDKIFYTTFFIILFSIIYMFFDNDNFSGWINVNVKHFEENDNRKRKIFYKYAVKHRDFMTEEEFIGLPMRKIGNHLYIFGKHAKDSKSLENAKIRKILYDIYSLDQKLILSNFIRIPFSTYYFKFPFTEDIPNIIEQSKRYAVEDYFDRLYFSVVTQTTLGYGDIFPADKMLRLVAMLQALTTIFIIVI